MRGKEEGEEEEEEWEEEEEGGCTRGKEAPGPLLPSILSLLI